MKHKLAVIASMAVLLVAITVVPNAHGWTFPTSPEVKNMTNAEFVKQAMLWESMQHQPPGAVLLNPQTNEWCVENCSKLSLVDPTLFATEETQKAKLQRTADFLNWTFQSASIRGGANPVTVAYYCDAMHSIEYKGQYVFIC